MWIWEILSIWPRKSFILCTFKPVLTKLRSNSCSIADRAAASSYGVPATASTGFSNRSPFTKAPKSRAAVAIRSLTATTSTGRLTQIDFSISGSRSLFWHGPRKWFGIGRVHVQLACFYGFRSVVVPSNSRISNHPSFYQMWDENFWLLGEFGGRVISWVSNSFGNQEFHYVRPCTFDLDQNQSDRLFRLISCFNATFGKTGDKFTLLECYNASNARYYWASKTLDRKAWENFRLAKEANVIYYVLTLKQRSSFAG